MKTIAAALALAFTAGAALAQDAPAFADLDTDASGGLSLTELQASYASLTEEGFAAIDTNADGSVDQTEFDAAVAAGTLVAE